MAANIKWTPVTTTVSTAASGTQDIAAPSGFGTPSCVVFFVSGATANGTIADDARIAIGAVDGTGQWVTGTTGHHNQNPVDNNLFQTINGCVGLVSPAGAGLEFLFSFSKWLTQGTDGVDGVQLSIDSQAAAAYQIKCLFIGGSDVVNAVAGYKDDLSNGTNPVNITDLSFTPSMLIGSVFGHSVTNGGKANGSLSFGIALNDGSETQRGTIIYSDDNVSPAAASGYISNTYFVGQNTATALDFGTAVTSFSASGFTVQSSGSPGRSILFYVALEFANSPDLALVDMIWPTNGNYAETGIGFQPDFGLISSLVGPSSRDTIDAANGVGLSFAMFDANNIYSENYTDYDGQITSVCKSLSANQLRILDRDGSTNAVVASSYAFDADGWDFTLSTNPGNPVLGWAFAFGDGTGGGPVLTQEMYVKSGGVFTKHTPHVKVGGAWQEVDAYVKSGGAWVQVHEKP